MAHGCARHLRGMNTQYEVVYVTQMNSSTMSVHHKTNDRFILRFKSKTVNSTQHQLRLYEGITRPLSTKPLSGIVVDPLARGPGCDVV